LDVVLRAAASDATVARALPKEGAVMDKRKMKIAGLGFISVLIAGSFLLGSVAGAGAETMKCRTADTATKTEMLPVGDEEGHLLLLQMAEGLVFYENGETAKIKAYVTGDLTLGKPIQVNGYSITTFVDGSTIVQRVQRLVTPDKSGIFPATMTGEIVKGTGRFEGIKGTSTSTGKNFMPGKGEAMTISDDVTITYTLPPK